METLVRDQAHAQAQAGHKVSVVVVNHQGKNGKNLIGRSFGYSKHSIDDDDAVRVIRVNRYASVSKCDISGTFSKAIRHIAASAPDVWHLHTPNATAVLGLQRNLHLCRPLVVSHHGDILNQRLLKPFYEFIENRVYRHAAVIVSDSKNYIQCSRQLTRHRAKVSVLPIGVEVYPYQNPNTEVNEITKRFRNQFGEPLWLCVGRLVPYKALDIALRALANVPGTLMIVGKGPQELFLRELTSKLKLNDRVFFAGALSTDELRGAYRAATALWFPSNHRSEGFGIVQVEAMASGCPVINTDLVGSGVSEVSIHNVTGLTVPCNNPLSLAKAAQHLLNDRTLRQSFSRAAVERSNFFEKNRLNDRWLNMYEHICTKHQNRKSQFPN